MAKYNLEKLIKTSVCDYKKSKWYYYLKGKKFLGINIRKEGVYMDFIGNSFIGECPKNHKLIDGVIYEKPHVSLYFQGDNKVVKYFENYNQAIVYENQITQDIQVLNFINE